ncbi:MAG: hypothetical protein H0Z34_00245 [Brevibacillus sp.]|nr:hypothetical protein [Brevibacillus sp.]
MQLAKLVRRLGHNDVVLIGRDRFLIGMFLFTLAIAVMLRFALPWLNDYLAEYGILPNPAVPISLADVYPMLVAFFALFQGALLVGMIFGFLLLDEKEDSTIKAMLVTPVPFKRYAMYRAGVPAILAFLTSTTMVLMINQALLPLWPLLLITGGASLTASIAALFFATFAENKVQGFALAKFGGIAGWTVLFGWFVPEPLQWLIGLFPPFWISKSFWMALEGSSWWWAALVVGIVLQAGLMIWLLQRFQKAAYR